MILVFLCFLSQLLTVVHISVWPWGLKAVNWYMFMRWRVPPLGVFPCMMRSRPSIDILVSAFVVRSWWQRACVTLGKKDECRAVITEKTYGVPFVVVVMLWEEVIKIQY